MPWIVMGMDEWASTLRVNAGSYARVALSNIATEFPSDLRHVMRGPDDLPRRPRERTPVFFGSFDWHSCVEMHWLLVRLLRVVPAAIPAGEIRAVLDAKFTLGAIEAEARYMTDPDYGPRQRPYGWGWALRLAYELASWDDPDARRWAENFVPLAETVADNFKRWFGKATYPVRHGVHQNSAFGLSRALPYARAYDGDLRDGITTVAIRWFGGDAELPGRLGTIRLRFPVAGAQRDRTYGATATSWRILGLAVSISARNRRRAAGGAVYSSNRLGFHRRSDRPSVRAQRESRMVLATDRGGTVAGGSKGWRRPPSDASTRRSRVTPCHWRRLHGRALAGRLCGVVDELTEGKVSLIFGGEIVSSVEKLVGLPRRRTSSRVRVSESGQVRVGLNVSFDTGEVFGFVWTAARRSSLYREP